jgi:hypothetical protein
MAEKDKITYYGHSVPRYQTIIPRPKFIELITNARPDLYFKTALFTGFTTIAAFATHTQHNIQTRRSCTFFGFSIGFLSSVYMILRATDERLRGFRENSQELKKFGIKKKTLVGIHKPVKQFSNEEIYNRERF